MSWQTHDSPKEWFTNRWVIALFVIIVLIIAGVVENIVGESNSDDSVPSTTATEASEESGATSPERPESNEAAEPTLTAEQERALELCETMDAQIDRGEARGPLNSFLTRNADGVNPTRMLTAMRNSCGDTVEEWEEASYAEFKQAMEESLAETEGSGPWWEELPQPLGHCFRDYNDADYLSPQALSAATCIVDELAFGGTVPTEDAVRNLTGEILFHATWATWDESSRRVQCQPIKQRGFDAAEQLGIATIRTWNNQLAGAGANKEFDDYAIVLDFLDVCETY